MADPLEDKSNRVIVEISDSINIESMGYIECLPEWTGNTHHHYFWEIIYVSQVPNDDYIMFYEGKYHRCASDSLYLLYPGDRHRFVNESSQSVIAFCLGFTFVFQPERKVKRDCLFLLNNMPDNDFVKSVLREITNLPKEVMATYLYNNRTQLTKCIVKILDYILLDDDSDSGMQKNNSFILVEKAKDFINNNINKNITWDDIAQQFYISPHYLGDIFKKNTGISLKEYHNIQRMERALRLVKETSLSISQIAEKLGFMNVHYFSKRFKDYYTVPPSYFRRNGST